LVAQTVFDSLPRLRKRKPLLQTQRLFPFCLRGVPLLNRYRLKEKFHSANYEEFPIETRSLSKRNRVGLSLPSTINERWSLDFVSDFSRECLATVVDTSLSGVQGEAIEAQCKTAPANGSTTTAAPASAPAPASAAPAMAAAAPAAATP
jgi:hypothetical protein